MRRFSVCFGTMSALPGFGLGTSESAVGRLGYRPSGRLSVSSTVHAITCFGSDSDTRGFVSTCSFGSCWPSGPCPCLRAVGVAIGAPRSLAGGLLRRFRSAVRRRGASAPAPDFSFGRGRNLHGSSGPWGVASRRLRAQAAEQIQKPMGASGAGWWQHRSDATDSPAEQSPEVGCWSVGWQHSAGRAQRREGNGCGDTDTAAGEGNASKGVAPEGRTIRLRPGCSKPGEPQGRLRGATNPRAFQRRKPSESGGTTWTEQAWTLARPGRTASFGSSGSGRW